MVIGIIISSLPAIVQMLWTPLETPWWSIVNVLGVSCIPFGFATNYVYAVGTIAPLADVSEKHAGMVNALVQASMSPGMTVHCGATEPSSFMAVITWVDTLLMLLVFLGYVKRLCQLCPRLSMWKGPMNS